MCDFYCGHHLKTIGFLTIHRKGLHAVVTLWMSCKVCPLQVKKQVNKAHAQFCKMVEKHWGKLQKDTMVGKYWCEWYLFDLVRKTEKIIDGKFLTQCTLRYNGIRYNTPSIKAKIFQRAAKQRTTCDQAVPCCNYLKVCGENNTAKNPYIVYLCMFIFQPNQHESKHKIHYRLIKRKQWKKGIR